MSFRDGGAGGASSRRKRGTGFFRSCVHGSAAKAGPHVIR
jgi:hypothetical protein